ncbi:unnamed protein product [Symbiodinium microadriaticum]|nr:unnamed protein product [Symbiodinium microadriaticum]
MCPGRGPKQEREASQKGGGKESVRSIVYGYEEELLQKAWKDAAYGAALFVDPEIRDAGKLLDQAGVAESPLGRVPKQNPDRTISAEGRPINEINDMRRQNDAGSKFNHPPAPQPRHHAVAHQSLWWRSRHPGIPQKCAKRDVPRAFKWHSLRAKDVPEFAVKLAGLVILSLAMPFGWVGSPGEFVAWSAAAKAHHGSFRPMEPRFNDVVPFESKWLMDDGVVVEPMVGNRVFDSLGVLDETMQLVWGPEGVNVEKMAEANPPSNEAVEKCRCVCFRNSSDVLSIVTSKAGGARGSRGKINVLVQKASSPGEEERRWEDFWDTLDFIRCHRPSQNHWGEAIPERIGAVDWKDNVFHADQLDQYRGQLARDGEETDIISVMELLAFVVLACHRKGDWNGELVLYVTDNMNVRLESESNLTFHPIYIRGWVEVDTSIHWEQFKRSALVYPTGEVCLRVPWQPLHVDDYPELTSCGIALKLFKVSVLVPSEGQRLHQRLRRLQLLASTTTAADESATSRGAPPIGLHQRQHPKPHHLRISAIQCIGCVVRVERSMGYAVICGTSQHSEIIDRSPALALYRAAYTGDMPQVAWDSFHNPSPRGAPPEGIDLTDHSEVAPAPSRANSGQGLPWKGTLATYSRKVAPLPSRDFAAEPAPEPDPTEAAGASSAASGRSGLVPWSIFQYLATSQRSFMDRIKQAMVDTNGRVWGSTIIRVKDRQNSDTELTAEEKAEIVRIEEECAELERRIGDRLERRDVTWTQEDVAGCITMEQFLDYLEARADQEDAPTSAAGTASKAAMRVIRGAPPRCRLLRLVRTHSYHDHRGRDLGSTEYGFESVGCTTPNCLPCRAFFYTAELHCSIDYHRCRAAS